MYYLLGIMYENHHEVIIIIIIIIIIIVGLGTVICL